MKIIDNLAAMEALLPPSLCNHIATILSELTDYFDGVPLKEVSFTALWGSPIYLVEQVEDLAQVLSCDEGPAGRLSVLDSASDSYDVAGWAEDGAFAMLGTIESNDGGPQYVIPRAIADLVPNVAESIRLCGNVEF